MAREVDEFTSFVREHTPALLRTAYLLTGNGNAAEELVQDTLVHLYPKRAKVFAAEVPLAYARRALTNAYINTRRRGAARETAVEVVPDIGIADSAGSRLADRDEVFTLLGGLPDRQRAALVLRYYHDRPDDEIADALGCRAGTVRSLISRGLATLRAGSDVRSARSDGAVRPGAAGPASEPGAHGGKQ